MKMDTTAMAMAENAIIELKSDQDCGISITAILVP